MPRIRACCSSLWILLLGCHAGVGPVVAYAPGHGGFGVGWELNAGYGPLQGDVGQVFRPAGAGADARTYHLAFEPGFASSIEEEEGPALSAGGTFGVAEDAKHRDHNLYGAYGGVLSEFAECPEPVVWSAALGLRFFGDTVEIYATPKFNLSACVVLAVPHGGD